MDETLTIAGTRNQRGSILPSKQDRFLASQTWEFYQAHGLTPSNLPWRRNCKNILAKGNPAGLLGEVSRTVDSILYLSSTKGCSLSELSKELKELSKGNIQAFFTEPSTTQACLEACWRKPKLTVTRKRQEEVLHLVCIRIRIPVLIHFLNVLRKRDFHQRGDVTWSHQPQWTSSPASIWTVFCPSAVSSQNRLKLPKRRAESSHAKISNLW